jgi:hypothetical protein
MSKSLRFGSREAGHQLAQLLVVEPEDVVS